MTRYYYDKYEYFDDFEVYDTGQTVTNRFFETGPYYSTVNLNSETGEISLTGSPKTGDEVAYSTYDANRGYYEYRSKQGLEFYAGIGVEVFGGTITRKLFKTRRSALDGKGKFIETIIAEDGAFPENGEVVEGGIKYWYIKRETAETATILQPAGGERIDKEFTIEWAKSSRAVLVDIDLSFDNGENWGELVYGIDGTSYTYDFRNENETSQARMRIRTVTEEGVGEWFENDGVFTINHDQPPARPTNLRPKGASIDRTIPQQFEWKHYHDNPQSKFDLNWSTNQQDWNRISRVTSQEYAIVSENTFPAGEIFWRVRTYSDAGVPSEWSERVVFTAGEPSGEPTITSRNEFSTARPTISWSQPDQRAYQIIVRNALNEVVWDSGEMSSKNHSVTIGEVLDNNTTYTLQLRTQTEAGLWTNYTQQEISISFDPPARPTIELIEGDHFIAININNPATIAGQVEVAYNEVFRDGVRIATRVGHHYKDYTAQSGKQYRYRVRAVGVNGGTNDSQLHRMTFKLKSSVLSNLNDDLVELAYNPARSANNNKIGAKMFFAGRKKPVFQYEEHVENNLDLSFRLLDQKALDDFVTLVEQRELLLYRDNRGRKVYGTIQSYDIDDNVNNTEWYEISFTFEELDYSEVV